MSNLQTGLASRMSSLATEVKYATGNPLFTRR